MLREYPLTYIRNVKSAIVSLSLCATQLKRSERQPVQSPRVIQGRRLVVSCFLIRSYVGLSLDQSSKLLHLQNYLMFPVVLLMVHLQLPH